MIDLSKPIESVAGYEAKVVLSTVEETIIIWRSGSIYEWSCVTFRNGQGVFLYNKNKKIEDLFRNKKVECEAVVYSNIYHNGRINTHMTKEDAIKYADPGCIAKGVEMRGKYLA